MSAAERAIAVATHRFARPPELLASAPGRVNLIGEHTDHQDGFVLPLAIEHRTWIAYTPNGGRRAQVVAADLNKESEIDLDRLEQRPRNWSNYLVGVAYVMQKAGLPLEGWDGVIASDVPRGAGLSSSAALEIAASLAFLNSPTWDATALAKIGQEAENEWVGVSSGIMDQLVSAAAEAGAALFIDCRTLATRPVVLPGAATVVVMDTSTRRGLLGSGYDDRRRACERVAATFHAKVLRDVSWEQLHAGAEAMTEEDFRRARHVISENDRVIQAIEHATDPETLGRLIDESHRSLQHDFEVSTPELDTMAEIARAVPGCFGARMTGGGFGGAAIALIETPAIDRFVDQVSKKYQAQTGLTPTLFATSPSQGATREEYAT